MAAAIVGTSDAADIAQESFIAAWRQLPALRDPAAFGPWVRRICVNRARNHLRAARRRGSPPVAWEDVPEPSKESSDFRSAVEARAVLEPAFDRLTPDQRTVLGLHYGMGYSIAETADALGVRVGTAKSRLNSGLNILRAVLASAPSARPEPEAAS